MRQWNHDDVPYDYDSDPEVRAPLRLDGAFWFGVGLVSVFAAGVIHIGEIIFRLAGKLL